MSEQSVEQRIAKVRETLRWRAAHGESLTLAVRECGLRAIDVQAVLDALDVAQRDSERLNYLQGMLDAGARAEFPSDLTAQQWWDGEAGRSPTDIRARIDAAIQSTRSAPAND